MTQAPTPLWRLISSVMSPRWPLYCREAPLYVYSSVLICRTSSVWRSRQRFTRGQLRFPCKGKHALCIRQSGSQNLAVLPKRHDTESPFSSQLTKPNTVSKLLWPLLVVNLKILGLIWQGKAYFVQNNTTIGLRDDTRRTASEVPCRTPAVHFWRQINSLKAQNFSYFSLFTIWYMVFEIASPFLCIFNSISSEKRGISVPFKFPDLLTFPARWMRIGQFKFPARQPYAPSCAARMSHWLCWSLALCFLWHGMK